MLQFIILGAMTGQFISASGNIYDNFQMMGYMSAEDANQAVTTFFDQTPYPIQWADVDYLWAEELVDSPKAGHHGDYDKVYVEALRERWTSP